MRILIVGFSTRAVAESAVRSGRDVVTLDYFGDRDQREFVPNYALQRDFNLSFSAEALLRASRSLEFDAVVYISNLENSPDVVEGLARRRELLGNSPDVLREVRDWAELRAVCNAEDVPYPTTLLAGEEAGADSTRRWLRKPVRGGGGRDIQRWRGEALEEDHILQVHVEGLPSSAAFVADGSRSVLIGLTEQLIGREALGAGGFCWCGNILPLAYSFEDRLAVLKAVERMVGVLTRRFGLRGVNGVDLVIAEGPDGRLQPYLVEVNPRYTASMELVERAYADGLNVFSCHLAAMDGVLPEFSLVDRLRSERAYFGKGVVYAGQTVTVPETRDWIERDRRDIPFPGERIEAGHPICTVLAEGESRSMCWRRLVVKARDVRREIGDVQGQTGGVR